MAWPHFTPVVTVCDVLESGACLDGVVDWVKRHKGLIAGKPEDFPRQPEIQRAACANGDGYGDGNGDGGSE